MQDKSKKNIWGDSRPGTSKKNIRFSDKMISEIENHINCHSDQKKISFSEWVKDACQQKLDN